MKVETTRIPKKYEDAIGHWVKHNFQDLPLLEKYWDKYFPSDDAYCLCAKLDKVCFRLLKSIVDRFKNGRAKHHQGIGRQCGVVLKTTTFIFVHHL